MILRAALVVIAVAVGGYMVLDGSRNLLTGTYFGGGRLGPWSALVALTGLDPLRFGAAFAVLGATWLVALAGLLAGARWGWPAGLTVAVLTLWYLPLGTALAVAWIVLLLWRRRDLVGR